ncbi:Os05g0417700 [Oryza sativa Japonica Group]|uniref:Os05g0417700 protein n=3 Tax=Oryza TaxID=4527 RepID=B7F9L3_ORYSJ|nr:uncharacterized protein LOC4338811 [Oryza sativa Japonica Group]KAF2930808.1 hypothetical protein DAI22_05g163300 [Oryza sativa Japonica Group]BAH01311.1 unnamed protein product [Oryza sativa Japonica Group]BAS94050.1 Os05g0417700 [Oryza sativa Japonica Group]
MSLLSPPPPLTMTRGASHSGGTAMGIGGSYGPVIVALAIIATLTVASIAVGQLCVGRGTPIKPGQGMGAFVKKSIGGNKAAYDDALPEKKKEEDVENATVEEVEKSEPPKVEEDDDGSSSQVSS